jgi:hypothetical protein
MHPLARPRTAFAETQPTSQPGPLANCVVAAWHGSLAHRRKTASPDDGTLSVCELAVLDAPGDAERRRGEPAGGETANSRFPQATSRGASALLTRPPTDSQ